MKGRRVDGIDVLFAVIAPREVVFFSHVAEALERRHGARSAFLTFYQPGDSYLRAQGRHVFSLHDELGRVAEAGNDPARVKAVEAKYGIRSVRDLIIHEKLTFNRFDEEQLIRKALAYDGYFERLFGQCAIRNVVQELGGFIAPMSLYYNSLSHQIRHVFLEPAMFKGRLFFNEDSLNACVAEIPGVDGTYRDQVTAYIDQYNRNQTVVVPEKDRHHFLDAGLRKLMNRRNIGRLCGKLYHKYWKGEKEEYDAIWNHVRRSVSAVAGRRALASAYVAPDYSQRYLYFPLHVPLDFQLTVRENRYLDQLWLVERLASLLPYGYRLFIKEHPASIGAYDHRRLKNVLKNPDVRLIHPAVNSYDLIAHAHSVVTINSKVGAEALMQGKRVLVLGQPFYSVAQGAIGVDDVDRLPTILQSLNGHSPAVDYDFFAKVMASSEEAELYVQTQDNVERFTNALVRHLSL